MMRPMHSLDRLLAQLRHGRQPNFFPHLLVAVVAPVADALALSSSSAGIVPMRWASRAVYDACVYRKLKLGRSGGEVRQGCHVI